MVGNVASGPLEVKLMSQSTYHCSGSYLARLVSFGRACVQYFSSARSYDCRTSFHVTGLSSNHLGILQELPRHLFKPPPAQGSGTRKESQFPTPSSRWHHGWCAQHQVIRLTIPLAWEGPPQQLTLPPSSIGLAKPPRHLSITYGTIKVAKNVGSEAEKMGHMHQPITRRH